jgi:beta-glucanase (GH16 family)
LARPGQVGNNEILVSDFNVFDFGGFGQDLVAAEGGPQDWSTFEAFDFWFYGTGSGLTYQAEISDNRSDPNSDTSERFDYEFVDSVPGWKFISIPFADFTRATDFQPGGAPDDGFTLTEIWAWAIVLPQGVDSVYFDDFSLGQRIVDDFENGLPSSTDGNGIPIGFYTFQGAGSSIAIVDASTPPAPLLPEVGLPNHVLQIDVDSTSYAGMIHGFESEDLTTWVSQDWSAYAGLGMWLYGNNSGTSLFIDLLENRNPGSTTDDAERWTVTFTDDFSGWQYLEFPFNTFTRKAIGNGAPNDGLTLEEVHGWAFGTLGTGGPRVYYIDNVSLFGVAEVPELAVTYSAPEYEVTEGADATITVKLTRELGASEDDPTQVSIDFSTELGTAVADRDYIPASGTFTFVQGGPTEQTFVITTFDNPKHDGDKTAILRLSNPVDITPGFTTQAVLAILDDDPLDPNLLDDFERGAYLRDGYNVTLNTPEIMADDPLALPVQGDYEHILKVDAAVLVDIVINGNICNRGNGVIPVALLTTESFNALSVDHNTVRFGDAVETHRNKKTGEATRHEKDFEGDGDIDLIFHFRAKETGYDCDSTQFTLTGETFSGQPIVAGGEAHFGRDFPIGQNWTRAEALRFWFYGTNSGDAITMQLKDNRAPDPGPSGWNLVWSDEFDDPAGTPPNPAYWSYEIGDGAANRIPGWGNNELQYYTSRTENSATDGLGNLVITVDEADGSQVCYYGPCEYTSARLISQYKAEFAYGRIESRIRVPDGEAGLWPAYWSLGTDIGEVGWPQTGEIDLMEYVSRLPNEIFGTIHGPGYSGGASFGNIYDFGEPVFNDYHSFAIEWEPDLIRWYVDGTLYHTATPADITPNEWVFNDPVFLIFNVAVGGNFGGPVSPDLTFPQEMVIDYLRVYQGPDTAERWEATFADNFVGWQQVVIPFASLIRSANQPAGAPDDGLTLSEVWGYGFELPEGGTTSGTLLLDQVQLELIPPPTEITVTSLNDNGDGSLRKALEEIAIGGTITFDSGLAGGTLVLTSGPLVPVHNVTIDGVGVPGLSLDGGGGDRVLIVDAGLTVNLANLTVTNGYGWQLAGGILNNGNLALDHVTVTGNTMATDAGDFWQGGGGIYTGEGGSLTLVDSSVINNNAGWSGGGVYSFFNTTTTIVRSTIAGNVSNDVGGGIRLLGNAEVVNSTISGNEATGWYGGALFMTDGIVDMTNTTIVNNVSPPLAPAAVFVGTFGDGSATLNLANSIIANNVTEGCFLAPFGAGPVAINSLGNNLFTDGTCFPVASDQIVADGGIDALADNGGPTLTHALLVGSPAIDAGNNAYCPVTDQRGVLRDAACDVGAFEFTP